MTAALVFGFVVSIGHAITWFDRTGAYTVALQCGGLAVGWRPPGYVAETDRFRARPGISDAEYAGDGVCLGWLPTRDRTSVWTGITIPIWMVLVPVLLPTGWLWWRDRRRTRAAWRRLATRIRPRKPVRLTMAFALLCIVVYGLSVGVLGGLCMRTVSYLFPYSRWVQDAVHLASRGLLLATPIAGPLCAWAWIRFRNRLFHRLSEGANCALCGYDLRGNVSGRCPECGTTIPPRSAPADT